MNTRDEDGRTILHHTRGDISALLAQGADPNITDEGGWSPLMSACSIGDVVKVKQLLSYPSLDVNLRNDSGCTALHYAASKGHIEVVKALLEREDLKTDIQDNHAKSTPLVRAITTNHLQVVRELLKVRPRLNLRDSEGNTALHYAIAMENVDLAVDLINNGALDNVKNIYNQTPLDVASPFMRNRLEEEL